jgi:hypothetical protein
MIIASRTSDYRKEKRLVSPWLWLLELMGISCSRPFMPKRSRIGYVRSLLCRPCDESGYKITCGTRASCDGDRRTIFHQPRSLSVLQNNLSFVVTPLEKMLFCHNLSSSTLFLHSDRSALSLQHSQKLCIRAKPGRAGVLRAAQIKGPYRESDPDRKSVYIMCEIKKAIVRRFCKEG